MKAAVRAICRPEVALGLGLAGIAPIEVADADGAAAALRDLAGAPAAGGVILVERPLFDGLPPALRRQIERAGQPILVPFPGPAPAVGARAPDEDVLEILRQAIGYRVRLR